MGCGFAFLEAGSVRAKNVVDTCLRNLVDQFGIFLLLYLTFILAMDLFEI